MAVGGLRAVSASLLQRLAAARASGQQPAADPRGHHSNIPLHTANVSMDMVLNDLRANRVKHIGEGNQPSRTGFQGVTPVEFCRVPLLARGQPAPLWDSFIHTGLPPGKPGNLVAMTSQADVAQFLQTQLNSRYQAEQIIHLAEGKPLFYRQQRCYCSWISAKDVQPSSLWLGFDPRKSRQIRLTEEDPCCAGKQQRHLACIP